MRLSELSRKEEIGILDITGAEDVDLSDPRYDSRQCREGSTFFAIRGYQTDGHKFISKALELGASCIVLEDDAAFTRKEAVERNVTRILVRNSRKALAYVAEEAFGNPSSKLRLIGVTGTNGKTTTTNIIKQLLEWRGETVGIIGTIGIRVADVEINATHTTPESRDISEILKMMVDKGATSCVMEVSSHALALDRVAALDFDIAAFTNLTPDHLDFHHTMEDYFLAKKILFDSLKDTAVAVTNADSEHGLEIVRDTVANSHSYGVVQGKLESSRFGHADLVASNVELSFDATRFTLQKRYSDEHAEVSSRLIGMFNVENILAAASALYFGVEGFSLEVLAEGLARIEPVRGRFESVSLPNKAIAIIDYAHTPDALQHVLETLRQINPSARIITVFGCGGDRDRTKRPVMGKIAAQFSHSTIITNDNPRSEKPEQIAEEILSGIPEAARGSVTCILDRRAAIERALELAAPGDAVLIAGKGHETYQIFSHETTHFDDREEILRVVNSSFRQA